MTWLAIRAVLGRVPVWAWAIALALAWGGVQHHRATVAGQRALKAEKDLATLRADAAQLAIDTLARTTAKQQEAAHAAKLETAAASAAAGTAADALRRLRQRAAAAGGSCPGASAAAGSAPAGAGPAVPADVLGRIGEAAGRLAAAADARGIAGQACERSYEALRR